MEFLCVCIELGTNFDIGSVFLDYIKISNSRYFFLTNYVVK